jgi:hypothetical protein
MPEYDDYRRQLNQIEQDRLNKAEEERRRTIAEAARKEAEQLQERKELRRLEQYVQIAKPHILQVLKDFNEKVLSQKGVVHNWNTLITPPYWLRGEGESEDPDSGSRNYYIFNSNIAYQAEYSFAYISFNNRNKAVITILLEKEGFGGDSHIHDPYGYDFDLVSASQLGPQTDKIRKTGLSGFLARYDELYRYEKRYPHVSKMTQAVPKFLTIACCDLIKLQDPLSWESKELIWLDPDKSLESFRQETADGVFKIIKSIY